MEKVKGSHGTCVSISEIIQKSQTFIGSSGMRGSGAYFWREHKHYLRLAKSWYLHARSRGQYNGQFNGGCAILVVDIECELSAYLNLQDSDIKDRLGELMDRLLANCKTTKDLARGYDMVFKAIEADAGEKIKLIRTDVSVPGGQDFCKYYNIGALGSPSCLIARSNDILKNISMLSDEESEGL